MGSKKARVFEEAAAHSRTSAHALNAGVDPTAKSAEVVDRRVGQGGVIEMIPERFHRIQFRSVSGQPLYRKPPPVLPQSALDPVAAMSRQPIPQQNHPLAAMTPQGVEETDHLRSLDPAGMHRQQPPQPLRIGRRQHQADPGEPSPVEGFANDGRLPPRRPGGADWRPLGKSGFVQKTDPSLQSAGVFFTWGQRPRTHRAMAVSSRSLARRAGRWRLQPNWPRRRHTWGRE